MAGIENPQELAQHKVRLAVDRIAYAGVEGVSDIAERTRSKLRSGEVIMASAKSKTPFSPLTGFAIRVTPFSESEAIYSPVLVFDTDRVLFAKDQTVQADLVRTIAVLDTFPVNGYENRLGDVYGDALDLQEEWLTTHDAVIPADPRKNHRQSLLRELLGDEQYFMDVGLADWQWVIEGMKEYERFDSERLSSLHDDKSQFFSARMVSRSIAYKALQTLPNYQTVPAQIRAYIGAKMYLRNYLGQRRGQDN